MQDERQAEDAAAEAVLERAAAAEAPIEAVTPLLDEYRARLERMLRLRMDPRVVGRVGVSDVIQETLVEVAQRLPGYLDERTKEAPSRMPFFLWVRFLAGQALQTAHRRHLGTQARDAAREVSLEISGGMPEATARLLASAIVASGVSPASEAAAGEQRELLANALDELEAEDREVLFLRHFEQLSTGEIGKLLGVSSSGASLRHLRALGKLQRALARIGVTFEAEYGTS